MTFQEQLLDNYLLISALLSWFVAQVCKTAIDAYFNKGINWERMTGSGGMPSSHSSTVVALATAAGISYGVDSAIFRLLLDNPFAWTGKEFEKKLKEYVGHSPLQVLMGAILGLAIAVGMGYVYGYFG